MNSYHYGKVKEFTKVELCTEKLFDFNGRKILKSEKIAKGVVPNAIFVNSNAESIRGGIFEPCNYTENFIIGNLTSEAIKNITSQLCEKGFYDFSSLEYQDYKNINELVIDGGKSLPYVNCNVSTYFGKSFSGDIYPSSAIMDNGIFTAGFDKTADANTMSCDEADMDTEGDEYSDDDMDTEGDEE